MDLYMAYRNWGDPNYIYLKINDGLVTSNMPFLVRMPYANSSPLTRYRRPERKFPGQWKSNWTWCSPTSSQTSSRRWACGSAPCWPGATVTMAQWQAAPRNLCHIRYDHSIFNVVMELELVTVMVSQEQTEKISGRKCTNDHLKRTPYWLAHLGSCNPSQSSPRTMQHQEKALTKYSLPLICSREKRSQWILVHGPPEKSGTTENPSQEGSKASWIATSIKLSQVFSSDVTIVDFSESEIKMKGKRSIYFLLATKI